MAGLASAAVSNLEDIRGVLWALAMVSLVYTGAGPEATPSTQMLCDQVGHRRWYAAEPVTSEVRFHMQEGPSGQGGRACWARHCLKWIYWAAAAGLAPWIVYLYLTQIPRALAYQLRVLVIGIILVTILGALVTAWMYSRRFSLTVMVATYTATTAFISVWFRLLTRGGGSNLGESRPVFVVAAGIIFLLCVIVIAASRPSSRGARARWLPIILVAAALALIPSLAIALIVKPDIRIEQHLQIAWTGLDVFELLAMAVTGLALHRHAAIVVIPVTITGALLLCDAWINIIPVRGGARVQAIAFAFIEVPLAFLSLWIALQVSRRSTDAGDATIGQQAA